MPAYTNLRTFINALKTGKSHIAECLDTFFSDLNQVRQSSYYEGFATGNWSDGPPPWLEEFFRSIGLTPQEAAHVVHWPASELEKTRAAASAAVAAGQPPTFFWTLYDGPHPLAVSRSDSSGQPQVLFQSPAASLRLTHLNYGEVYVEEL